MQENNPEVEKSESGASLLEVLEEATTLVDEAKSMPLSASVLINKEEMLDLLETARAIVPAQIVEADSVLQDVERVSDEAQEAANRVTTHAKKKAQEIVAEAREQASRLVAQDSITVSAKSQSTKIIDEAKSRAVKIKRGADKYSADTLSSLAEQLQDVQEYLAQIQAQIAAGQEMLAEREQGAQAEEDAE